MDRTSLPPFLAPPVFERERCGRGNPGRWKREEARRNSPGPPLFNRGLPAERHAENVAAAAVVVDGNSCVVEVEVLEARRRVPTQTVVRPGAKGSVVVTRKEHQEAGHAISVPPPR